MALIGLNRDELDLSQLPKDSFYDPKKDDDLSGIQVRMTITFRITNPDGTVVREWTEPAHSLNVNFVDIIQALWAAAQQSVVNTSGTGVTIQGASGGAWSINAPSGNDAYGIVVGSGQTPGNTPIPSTSSLAAQIPNGISSGQLEYGAVSISSVSTSGQTTSFTISRSFTNVSGATINVNEIGIVALVSGFGLSSSQYVLIAYDIPSSNIAIQNGQTLTITYTFSVTT